MPRTQMSANCELCFIANDFFELKQEKEIKILLKGK